MKKTAARRLFGLVWACIWVAAAGSVSTAAPQSIVTYTDLTPPAALGGALSFTTETQQGGASGGHATMWTGVTNSLVNLHPTGWDYSEILAGAGNQQAGYTYSTFLWAHRAAIWNGTAASHRNLNPSWSIGSMAIDTTGTQQVGYATTSGFLVCAVLWSGTASSVVNLHPSSVAVSSIARAIAGDQQGGMVNYNGIAHAALWSGTVESYRNLHPGGQGHSEILGMTTGQQVGYANGHAGIWFGTAESFLDIHPAGSAFSEAHATTGATQAGFAVFDSYRHAILWFGTATNYLDLHPALGSQYRASEAYSVWTDGSRILVAGLALDWPGYSHPILWSMPVPCTLTCPTNLVVCADSGQCGAVVHYPAPFATNCAGTTIESDPPPGSFFPVGTNLVTCVARDSGGEIEDTCTFQVVVRDCEPPVVHSLAASPEVLWPPDRKMHPVTLRVSASDNCGSTRSRILSVSSSDSADSARGSHNDPAWQITGDLTLNLRAERSDKGTGRVYTITVQCTDNSGNDTTTLTHVTVQRPDRDDAKIALPNPALTIKHAGAQHVISWPTNYVGFTLVSSHNLTNWIECADSPVTAGGQCWITNSMQHGARFFRLKK